MLRITVCKSASAAQSYYTQGLAGQEYYSEGQEITGTWHGRGAEMLNLPKLVNEADFAALTENRHPRKNKKLTIRQKTNRRVGYEFTLSAPKGVSLLSAIGWR